jgi:putative Ca2+/H+ antiporter (TMEM165/GDT1 family)
MLQAFLLIFVSIFLAQMGDKTQLITLLLAAKTKKHFLLFLAIMLGFLIGVTLAVFVGAGISQIIPRNVIKIASAVIFILLGLFLLCKKETANKHFKQLRFGNQFITTSLIILVADFGDKTQIALALFAISNNPFLVIAAGILALSAVTILTIYFSKAITAKIKPFIIEKAAGALFILMGIVLFLQKA